MRRFIRYLRAAWLYSQHFPYVEEADADGFWTDSDSLALHHFLESQTGQKFGHILRNYAINKACEAVRNPTNSPYNNGVAAGIPMLITAIENLSAIPTDTESEQSETSVLDQLETAT